VLTQVASPGSEHAPTSELSDATTAETSSFVRPVSDTGPQPSQQPQPQHTVVIVEQPPTPDVPPSPPTSLPLPDSQSAARVRSTDRSSPRLPAAVPTTSDSLPPVAEEEITVADDNNAVGPAPPTNTDDVFPPTAGNEDDDVEMKSQTGLNAGFIEIIELIDT